MKGEKAMFVNYNGQLYRFIKRSLYIDRKPAIATDFKEKTDASFIEVSDYFIKEFDPDDPKIREMFDVDFFVVYDDKSKTVQKKSAELKAEIERGDVVYDDERDEVFNHIWSANGGAPILNPPTIVNNEVELILGGKSYSDDWIEFDLGWCYKAVNIYDCERLFVRYTYTVRGGRKLSEKEVVEVTMQPEEFKAEKLKYAFRNI